MNIITLKLLGIVSWSWWVILLPLLIVFTICLAILLVTVIRNK